MNRAVFLPRSKRTDNTSSLSGWAVAALVPSSSLMQDIEAIKQTTRDILNAEPQIQLAFVDVRMPEIDGLQICEKIKLAGSSVKVVIISGFRDFEYARQALRYGVADYLLKPVNPSDVLRLVHEVMQIPLLAADLIEKRERLLIEQVRTWVHNHLHQDITLIDLSQRFHYSLNYVSMLFKKEIGTGFQEYLLDCRMQRAKHLLPDPGLRVADIAQQVGYTNPRAFSIAFRKACGLPPTEYREMRGREIDLLQNKA